GGRILGHAEEGTRYRPDDQCGSVAFPTDMGTKVPASIADAQQAMKCIVFELPTAAGFHLHRANESVLRCYWDAVTKGQPPPRRPQYGHLSPRDGETESRFARGDLDASRLEGSAPQSADPS